MKPAIKAAGVLPYSKDAQGNTWFLLGREKPNQSWGIDSGSWSEFGGSLMSGETPEEGAAREFFEESMGCMWHKDWMENELKKGRYLLAMDSRTPTGKGYRSFVKYVPFVDYPAQFARHKMLAKKQPEVFKKMVPDCFHSSQGTMLQTCMEKSSMGWFSVDQMRQAVVKYKRAKQNVSLGAGGRDRRDAKQNTYYEHDMIPHIRRGFAMDFDHLLTTEWARNNFQDDHVHFPLVHFGGEAACKTPRNFEIIQTKSGTLRPLVRTPRFTGDTNDVRATKGDPKTPYCPKPSTTSAGVMKPPILEVSTEGYSFKKKRRKRKVKPPEKRWTLVTSKKKKNKEAAVVTNYKPKPPVF